MHVRRTETYGMREHVQTVPLRRGEILRYTHERAIACRLSLPAVLPTGARIVSRFNLDLLKESVEKLFLFV